MPLLSPEQPKKVSKKAIFENYDFDGSKAERSKSHSKPKPEVVGGLCRIARRLAGGKVPRYKQEATVNLYVHLKNCRICEIPDRPPLSGKTMKLVNKLIEIGLFDSKDLAK